MAEPSDARARAQQRELDRQRARDERKAESERRRGRRASDEDEAANPNDAMAAAGWDRKEYNARQKAKAGSAGGAGGIGGDGGQEMSQEDQMIAHATKLQSENQSTLKNTIKVARETTVVGASTIHKLNEQTEQFQRMDNTLTETNDSISRSERILRGMKSFGGAITNMFTSSKPKQTPLPYAASAGAGGVSGRANETNNLDELDRQRAAKRAVEQDRAKQMDFDGGSDARAASSSSYGSSSSSGTKGREVVAPNSKQQAAISTFAANQRAEDDALDELSDVLGTLKQQSQTMSSQLTTQAAILDGLDAKVDGTSARLQKGSRTMAKIS